MSETTFWNDSLLAEEQFDNRAVDMPFFLRDHDILRIGWNLALMDYFEIQRSDSLIQYWGP